MREISCCACSRLDFSRSEASSLLQVVVERRHIAVQPRVLDDHRQLARERRQERSLVLAQRARPAGIDGEDADRIVADDEAEREHRADP